MTMFRYRYFSIFLGYRVLLPDIMTSLVWLLKVCVLSIRYATYPSYQS